ncbi:MAG TPA: hypothetical protein VG755_42655 [Nannocystaceae bacterium]|nr:hypothetical protein [Nannocystaceae bacterium]
MTRAIIAATLAFAIARPVAAAEPAASDSVVRAELELDVTALGDDGELVERQIRVRGEALLRKREVLPAKADDDPRIVVAIEPLGDDGPGYRCRWGVYRSAEVVSGTDGVSVCKLCTETELVDHVEAAIERVVATVPREATPQPVGPTEPVEDDRTKRGLGPLGKAGIGVGVVGIAMLAAGIPLAAIAPKAKDESELGHDVAPTRPAGIALVGIATAALVTGVALLAVDRHRAKSRGPARATVVPAGAGIAIIGRF